MFASWVLAVRIASSNTPRTTAVKTLMTIGDAAAVMSVTGPSHARRIAGQSSSRIAWLCVAAMPTPSHSATRWSPADPSNGRFRKSRTKIVGASSPLGTAVVIMNDVTPEPLPKCLSPLTR